MGSMAGRFPEGRVSPTSSAGTRSSHGSASCSRKSRLVTIAGPGGVGKTRIARSAASQAAGRYPDGPWIVELSGLRDPALLPNTVASVLGLPEQDPRSALAVGARVPEGPAPAAHPRHLRAPARRLRRAEQRRAAGRARCDGADHHQAAARHAGRAHLPGRPLPVPARCRRRRGDAVDLFALRAAAVVRRVRGDRAERARRHPAVPQARRHTAGDRTGRGAAARAAAAPSSSGGSTAGSRC